MNSIMLLKEKNKESILKYTKYLYNFKSFYKFNIQVKILVYQNYIEKLRGHCIEKLLILTHPI